MHVTRHLRWLISPPRVVAGSEPASVWPDARTPDADRSAHSLRDGGALPDGGAMAVDDACHPPQFSFWLFGGIPSRCG